MTSDAQILAPPAGAGEGADPRRWLTLAILLLAAFMNLLDVSIVNIAIPSIQRDLHASYADVQWALAGYTLAYALVLITGGRLGDTFGRKRLFLIGVTGFTIMSALCGAAQSPGMLIASRVLQGAMGAIMIPQVLSVIQVIFPPGERIKALAGFGVTAGLGTVSGPLLGGLLTEHSLLGLGWRSIFLINVPIGIFAVAAAAVLVRESRAPRPPRLDPVGVALISAALLLLLYPLVQGRQFGWPTWTFVSMAASAPVFALFVAYERVKTRRDGSPLVQLSLFSQRSFSVGMAIAVTFFLGITSFALILTLFLQTGLGFTPLHAGLTFLPFSGGVLLASGAAARLAPRFGRGVTMTGALVMAAGTSGLLNTGFQVGASIGIAVIGVIFFGLLGSQSGPAATAVTPQLRTGLAVAGVPAQFSGRIVTQFRSCLYGRLVAADPTTTPASCRRGGAEAALPASANRVLAEAGGAAVRRDFASSLERTLAFQVGVFLLSFLLMLALPARSGRRLEESGGPAGAAGAEDAATEDAVNV